MKEYIMNKNKEAKDFYCENCKKQKKSKNIATNSEDKYLCNGCYGELLRRNLLRYLPR